MTILLPETATEQTFKFIPLIYNDVTNIELIDEQQNTTQTAVLGTELTVSFYKTIGVTVALKEGSVYMAIFKAGTTEIFRDKVFSTSQPISTFTVNNGVYDYGPSTANQYILYGQ